MTLRENIKRALQLPCHADIVGAYSCPVANGVRHGWMRLQNVLALLKTGETFTCAKLAKLTGFCTKTIFRDLEFLRANGVKIIWDKHAFTYRLDGNFSLPPQFQLEGGALR